MRRGRSPKKDLTRNRRILSVLSSWLYNPSGAAAGAATFIPSARP
jgi:hypothetical protein